MACSQVTLDIALLWSADAGRDRVLLTSHSAGVKPFYEGTLFQNLSWSEKRVLLAERIMPTGIMACYQGSLVNGYKKSHIVSILYGLRMPEVGLEPTWT